MFSSKECALWFAFYLPPFFFPQAMSDDAEYKDVVFLKVDVDDAQVGVFNHDWTDY